jgi:hypothetical protein
MTVGKRKGWNLTPVAWINHSEFATGRSTTLRNTSGVLGGAVSVGSAGIGLLAGLAVRYDSRHAAARLQLRLLIANPKPKIQRCPC